MRRALVVLIVVMMCASGLLGIVPGAGRVARDGIAPLSEISSWSDSFEDMSKVYVPSGGLVGVEVSGGEARLKTGWLSGWVASEIIACPSGLRYDHMMLDTLSPGNSSVSVSVLDASEPGGGGFANGTIGNFTKVRTTDLSLTRLSPTDFPFIRLQADLKADGGNRPVLKSWTLFFVDEDVWHDEFLGTGKVSAMRKVNFTQDGVEVDLTRKTAYEASDYLAYPSAFYSQGGNRDHFLAVHPNAAHTGYLAPILIPGNASYTMRFADFDDDGNLDMAIAQLSIGSTNYPGEIRWGAGTDPWSSSRTTYIPWVAGNPDLEVGDVNGDGLMDLIFGNGYFFLNQGYGIFNDTPENPDGLGLGSGQMAGGDLNDDGYYDVVAYNYHRNVEVHYSGANGPEKDEVVLYNSSGANGVGIMDVDGDDYMDLVIPGRDGPTVIYLGGPVGPDTTPDIELQHHQPACYGADCGDIDGDGYIDLMVDGWTFNPNAFNTMLIYMGSPSGFSEYPNYEFEYRYGRFKDVNKDGYSDIVASDTQNRSFCVYEGGTDWDMEPEIEHSNFNGPLGPYFAIAPNTASRYLMGKLVTERISLPPEKRWDLLDIDVETPPQTAFKVSITDPKGGSLKGFSQMTDRCIDLSGLGDIQEIQLTIILTCELNNTTPVLREITVKWMDVMTWRDEFYAGFKVDRCLSCGVSDGLLSADHQTARAPELLFPSLRGDNGYSSMSSIYEDSGGLTYDGLEPMLVQTSGAMAADVGDVNGDGFLDVAFATYGRGENDFVGRSPVFLGSPVGFPDVPRYSFDTTGARDVLLDDLNGDDLLDLVLAQEQDGYTFAVESMLFWGRADGWPSAPDVLFSTKGASGVVAADLDGDGDKDLAFACYSSVSTSTDSMVFLQTANGFCGTVPSYLLPTKGARAVDAGDLNADGAMDLVFANSADNGNPRTSSYIYWGLKGGGFQAAPAKLATIGTEDVKAADLDGDGDLDLAFANRVDQGLAYEVDSYVYLNGGGLGFPSAPSARLPTTGAVAVDVADLDGEGLMDLVFACEYNGANYSVPSVAYLGGPSGWPSEPSFEVPTEGASDIIVARLYKPYTSGYLSESIAPGEPEKVGGLHTFMSDASFGLGQAVTASIVDAGTWQVLASAALTSGHNVWPLAGAFWFRDHPVVRVMLELGGLDRAEAIAIETVWLNWTLRVMGPPSIDDCDLSPASVQRLQSASLVLNVSDEYDYVKDLHVSVRHRLANTHDWFNDMIMTPALVDGRWTCELRTKATTEAGMHEFAAKVTDNDGLTTDWIVLPIILEVLNNMPTAPSVEILPMDPTTTSDLSVRITRSASDIDSTRLSYRYLWYRDGSPVADLTTDKVDAAVTYKGENWSVEVRAFDGDDEGPPGTAWTVIRNSPPLLGKPIHDAVFDEDATDTSIDLSTAATDPDLDRLSWTVRQAPDHVGVSIDAGTGVVTLRPEPNWSGGGKLVLAASDGESEVSLDANVTVRPVDDLPWFVSVGGVPADRTIELRARQGDELVAGVVASDVEGDALEFSLNSTLVSCDPLTGELRWTPSNEDVGGHLLRLTLHELTCPDAMASVDIVIVVENANDPVGAPRITSPVAGLRVKVNGTVTLSGTCVDADEVYGQLLVFRWTSNVTGPLGEGRNLTVSFTAPGRYSITLTVSDGEFEATAKVEIVVEAETPVTPPVTPEDKHKDEGPGFGAIATGAAIVAMLIVMGGRRHHGKER